MDTLLMLLNLVACATIWIAAMDHYLRHDRPLSANDHFNQVALILAAAGAFAAIVNALRGEAVGGWEVAFRIGVAMIVARVLVRSWRGCRQVPR